MATPGTTGATLWYRSAGFWVARVTWSARLHAIQTQQSATTLLARAAAYVLNKVVHRVQLPGPSWQRESSLAEVCRTMNGSPYAD